MALWKEPSSTPGSAASGTPASGSPTTVTELHKASEHADAYDRNEDFNPFHLGGRDAEIG